MSALQIHDGFEPYFAGRAQPFSAGSRKQIPTQQRKCATQKDSESAIKNGDLSPKLEASGIPESDRPEKGKKSVSDKV